MDGQPPKRPPGKNQQTMDGILTPCICMYLIDGTVSESLYTTITPSSPSPARTPGCKVFIGEAAAAATAEVYHALTHVADRTRLHCTAQVAVSFATRWTHGWEGRAAEASTARPYGAPQWRISLRITWSFRPVHVASLSPACMRPVKPPSSSNVYSVRTSNSVTPYSTSTVAF